MNARLTPRLVLLLLLPPLLWAGNAVVGRLAAGHVPPLALNALRWALALVLLLPFGWRAIGSPQARSAARARWRPLALLGLFGIGAYNALQYLALTTSTALNVTLIVSSTPVWMMAVGALVYRERPTRSAVLGAILSLAGVAVVLTRGDPSQLAAVRFVPGDLLMLVAAFVWALYSWLLARPPASIGAGARPDWDWAGFLLVQLVFGVVWAGAFAGVEAMIAPAPIRWSAWVVLALIYVAVGPSLIAYRCWGLAVGSVGPSIAALFGNLTPLFAAVLSALVVGEPPRAFHALAFALIVTGIVVSTRRTLPAQVSSR